MAPQAPAPPPLEPRGSPELVFGGGPQTSAPAGVSPLAAAPPAGAGSPETIANLSARIVKSLEGRSTRFNLELVPAGLGRVDVRVVIDQAGRISAAFACDTPQAAAELRARSAELQTTLQQAGLDVSGGLSFEMAANDGRGGGGSAAHREPNAAARGRAFEAALRDAAEADAPAAGAPLRLRMALASRLDVRI